MASLASRRQAGNILLTTLIVMLLVFLGFLYMARDTLVDTQLTGHMSARQKAIQAGDLALRMLEESILSASAGQPLEIAAAGQPWYRPVPPGQSGPDLNYWAHCQGASPPANCGVVSLPPGVPYSAYAVVQPTGRTDDFSCGLSQYKALYYDIFLHLVASSPQSTAADTETVYKLCVAQ